MKKIASIVLALVLVLAMAAPAMAEETSKTSSLTIKTVANHTYKIYQLLTGDVSGLADGTGTLSNIEAGQNLKDGTDVDAFIEAVKDLTGAELGDTAQSYVEGNPAYTIAGDGTEKSVTVTDGYYVVVDTYNGDGDEVTDGSDTISRYLVAVVGDTIMTPKTTTPTIDKKIIDTDANVAIDENKKTDTAAIGDVIEYEVTSIVPNTEGYKYYYYVLHDALSEGLTLNQDSFVVTIGNKELVKGTDYYVYFDEETNSFDLALADLKTLVDTEGNGIDVGADISIKYTATVNEKAEIGLDPNTNTANLEYSNNPGDSERKDVEDKPGIPQPGTATGEGPDFVTKTYVTELTIQKVDQNGMPLDGAEFTLTGSNLNTVIINTETTFRKAEEGEEAKYYLLKNGTYTETAPNPAAEGEEGYNANLYESTVAEYVKNTTLTATQKADSANGTMKVVGSVDAEGRLTFTGLNVGDYVLTETKTPTGYNTIAPITFKITATQSGSAVTEGGQIAWASDNENIKLNAANGVFEATIENVAGTILPSTGGIGTTIFYVGGGLLIAAAVVLLVSKRKADAK